MKTLQRVSGLLVAGALLMPLFASAQADSSSTVNLQVQSLLSQITSLEQQLHTLIQSVAPSSTLMMWQGSSTPPMWNASSTVQGMGHGMIGSIVSGIMGSCPNFTRNLSIGSEGSDVMQLQQMLQGDGFLSASSTGYFGPLTAHALAQFQTQFGITASSSATGFFGSLTRAFLGTHCGGQGQGQGGNHMGSSTPPMGWEGSSTPPMHPGSWMGTSTNPSWQGQGMMGSSTGPGPRPCPENTSQGAAAVLFVPHVILPMQPCAGPSNSTMMPQ